MNLNEPSSLGTSQNITQCLFFCQEEEGDAKILNSNLSKLFKVIFSHPCRVFPFDSFCLLLRAIVYYL